MMSSPLLQVRCAAELPWRDSPLTPFSRSSWPRMTIWRKRRRWRTRRAWRTIRKPTSPRSAWRRCPALAPGRCWASPTSSS
eukprot:scaffold3229_cov246-Pinguiococcus_pyrenoidosus.AAC.5